MKRMYRFPCGCEWPILEDAKEEGLLPLLDIDVELAPQDCPAVFALLATGQTKGVFQLESPLGRQWTKRLRPENVEHMGALSAILRPGCLNNIDEDGVSTTEHFIRRKNGMEEVPPYHPDVDTVLWPTYNLMVYQESAMAISRVVAGFTEEEADALRKAAGKKLASEMSKVEAMFMEGVKKSGVVTEEQGREIFAWIKESQRYVFNRCLHKHSLIRRYGKNRYQNSFSPFTVEEMYFIRNDLEYAKRTGHKQLRLKWMRLGHYGKSLSLCEDGRIRPNIIRDIQPAGEQMTYRLTLEDGQTIEVTDHHKFPTDDGERTLSEIAVALAKGENVHLFVCGEYEKTDNSVYKYSDFTNDDREKQAGKSGYGVFGPNNRWFTNGSYSEFVKNDKLIPRACARCSKTRGRLELHHISGDRRDSSMSNLERLCASCHKRTEYANGRVKRGEKGYPSVLKRVVSVVPYEKAMTYDVTMDGPDHNFVVSSGIVTCNSHAMSYGLTGYDCAYLKAHDPVAFFSGWLNNACHVQDPLEEIAELVNDSRLFGVTVEPPSLFSPCEHFQTNRKVITFGLANIKGVGDSQSEKISTAMREAEQELGRKVDGMDWLNFLVWVADRISPSILSRLIQVGALRRMKTPRQVMLNDLSVWDSLTEKERDWVRSQGIAFTSLEGILESAARPRKEGGACHNKNRVGHMQSQLSLLRNPPTPLVDTPHWIAWVEEQLLGISISCNQVDGCDLSAVNCSCLEYMSGRTGYIILGVEITNVHNVKTKKGRNPGSSMARLTITDGTCSVDAVVFPEEWKQNAHLLSEGNTVILHGERDKKEGSFIIKKVWQANHLASVTE